MMTSNLPDGLWPVLSIGAWLTFGNEIKTALEKLSAAKAVLQLGEIRGTYRSLPDMVDFVVAVDPRNIRLAGNDAFDDMIISADRFTRALVETDYGILRFNGFSSPDGSAITEFSRLDIRSEEEFLLQAACLGCMVDPNEFEGLSFLKYVDSDPIA